MTTYILGVLTPFAVLLLLAVIYALFWIGEDVYNHYSETSRLMRKREGLLYGFAVSSMSFSRFYLIKLAIKRKVFRR
jgi:hypothetical protein